MLRSHVNPQEALARLEAAAEDGRLDSICDRLDVRILGAFGSAVTGDAGPDSDLDVCVSFKSKPAILEIIDELTQITAFDHIDLTVLDGANPVIKARAVTGIGLYEDEPGRYALTQMAALGEYRDTAHLREMQLRALSQ